MTTHRASVMALMSVTVTALALPSALAVAGAATTGASSGSSASASDASTAWRIGEFQVDRGRTAQRSNVVLGRPNALPTESMQLGNGVLGAAV